MPISISVSFLPAVLAVLKNHRQELQKAYREFYIKSCRNLVWKRVSKNSKKCNEAHIFLVV